MLVTGNSVNVSRMRININDTFSGQMLQLSSLPLFRFATRDFQERNRSVERGSTAVRVRLF
jgi:hypothetical protein